MPKSQCGDGDVVKVTAVRTELALVCASITLGVNMLRVANHKSGVIVLKIIGLGLIGECAQLIPPHVDSRPCLAMPIYSSQGRLQTASFLAASTPVLGSWVGKALQGSILLVVRLVK